MGVDAAGRGPGAGPVALVLLLLAGCASQPPGGWSSGGAERGSYRVGDPYEINGVWYYPKVDYDYDKTGIASWYGQEFAGRYTANGEIFDPNRLTAANTTLPMPSIVRVINLHNGRSLQLRVNDRGPFVDGRLIDVSRRAAQLLGFESRGTTPVEVKILKDASIEVAEEAMREGGQSQLMLAAASSPASSALGMERARIVEPPAPRPAATVVAGPVIDATRTPAARAAPSVRRMAVLLPDTKMPPSQIRVAEASSGASRAIFVQAGAFAVRNNAQRVQSRIAALGSVRVMAAAVNGREIYRVRLGPLASKEEADRLLRSVVSSGYPGASIVTD